MLYNMEKGGDGMDRLLKTEESLRKNGFDADAFESADACVAELLRKIPVDATVAFGGSMTLKEMGLYELMKEKGYDVKWHWADKEDNLLRKVQERKVYITSSNAITEDGKLVNMDGNANRVASMLFGHEDVYVICGENKIVENLDAAFERIRKVAGPMNAKRLHVNTPCVHTGVCSDCDSPDRICNAETILHKKPGMTNVHIMILKGTFGY